MRPTNQRCYCDNVDCFAIHEDSHGRTYCTALRERALDKKGNCKFYKKSREWTKGKYYPGGYMS